MITGLCFEMALQALEMGQVPAGLALLAAALAGTGCWAMFFRYLLCRQ